MIKRLKVTTIIPEYLYAFKKCGVFLRGKKTMKLVDKIEQQILSLDEETRLANLKDIAYFIQCAAQMKKAEGNGEHNPLSEEV